MVKSEVGLGLVVTVIVIGVPTHPLLVGVTVYVVTIGEQVALGMGLLSAPVPLDPFEPVHDHVAEDGVGVSVIEGKEAEARVGPEHAVPTSDEAVMVGIALIVTVAVAVIAGQPAEAAML
jgi:hypothetical protein